jgi:hypothetical protein
VLIESLGGSIRPLLRFRYSFVLMPLWSEHTAAYNIFHNIVAIIVLENGAYV